jgi:hypothetical protein
MLVIDPAPITSAIAIIVLWLRFVVDQLRSIDSIVFFLLRFVDNVLFVRILAITRLPPGSTEVAEFVAAAATIHS